jgi:ABC-type bacteriocin/lantibiotic exporter with double-glycine peptidase domain
MKKNVLRLFSFKQKIKISFLLFLTLSTAFLDGLSILTVVPFLGILSNPQFINDNLYLNNFYQLLNNFYPIDQQSLILVIGLIFFIFLFFSIFLRAVNVYFQNSFSYDFEYELSIRLLKKYLNESYSKFLDYNSSELSKNILSDVSTIIHGVVIPGIVVTSQSILCLFLLTLFFVIETQIALYSGFFLVFIYVVIFYSLKNLMKKKSNERMKSHSERFKTIFQVFGAIKEVKMYGLEDTYVNNFLKPAKVYARANAVSAFISVLPRNLLEIISLGGFIVLIVFYYYNGTEFSKITTNIAIYTLIAYRLLPSLQTLYSAISTFRFHKLTFNLLYEDLIFNEKVKVESKKPDVLSFHKSIVLKNISFTYPNSTKNILKNISISIPYLKKVAIVGPTGSGKTTLIDIILGLLNPNQGTIKIDDSIIDSNNKKKWQKSIGYVPQQIYLLDSCIASNIAFGIEKKKIDLKKVVDCAKIANIHEFIEKELPEGYDTVVGERGIRLSGGEKQRIGIARALYHKPKLIIFDEATNALDKKTEKLLIKNLFNIKSNLTIIFVTHSLNIIKNFDKIFVLNDGSVKLK